MKLKKIILIIFVLLITSTFVGCEKDDKKQPSVEKPNPIANPIEENPNSDFPEYQVGR